jgi:glyoxylase-like metal-dependent hydrolase (beta-lactamase superfamily II)
MRKYWFALAILCLFPVACPAQDAETVLGNAARAMGATNLKSIRYSGSGSQFVVGQNWSPYEPWPRFNAKSYTYSMDYETPAGSEEMVRTQALHPPHGGGPQPIYGDVLQIQSVSGAYSWSMAGKNPVPQPAAGDARLQQIWITPHGFLLAAIKNHATVKPQTISGKKYNVVTFMGNSKSKIVGYINDRNLVEKVDTWIDNPVYGDMLVEGKYSGYKNFGGIQFPGRIVQEQGGYPVLDLTITDVQPNAPVIIPVPDAVRQAPAAAQHVDMQKLADGVYYFAGTTHTTVAVEFKDYIVAIEAPLSEERSLAVIPEIKRAIPNKPIKYLISTHHHVDHSGGVRAYAAEGATILVYAPNKAFYEKLLATPHTIHPDRLSESKVKPRIEVMSTEKKIITDGSRVLELYHTKDNPHNAYMLMAYLPADKIIVEADLYTPSIPGTPPPAYPLDLTFPLNLYDNLQRLKLDVTRIAALHNRVAPVEEFLKVIGKPSL